MPAESDSPRKKATAKKRRQSGNKKPTGVVGLGASAGGVAVLRQFFEQMPANSGLAFVVVMHLSPEHESNLAAIIQTTTSMPVLQVQDEVKVQPNRVYVIPPNKHLSMEDSTLRLRQPQQAPGKRIAIDLFFRTLALAYGQRAVCVLLSGTDSDGVIGLKHIKAQGGVTMAQDPAEAEYDTMPRAAIDTGMVDWVLRAEQMPAKLVELVQNEKRIQLPPESSADEKEESSEEKAAPDGKIAARQTHDPDDESALRETLSYLTTQTGHDFSHYKRATVLRRIARRLQVNSLEDIPSYLVFLRSHADEPRALLHDMLIGVTHFFRDQPAFAALEGNIPQFFTGKSGSAQVRAWVPGCATGEEAYSIAMLLCEQAERLDSPPTIQVFATDIDEEAVQDGRAGVYPMTIEADVSQERLRRFFLRDHGRYRIKKEIRELVLFAPHDVLKDPPFSHLDLISCRNLLIYLKRQAQQSVLDIFHFALRSGGLLFIGGSESVEETQTLFSPIDKMNRLYVRRSVPRPGWTAPNLPLRVPRHAVREIPLPPKPLLPAMQPTKIRAEVDSTLEASVAGEERRALLFGELHLKLLEQYGPPSVVINAAHDVVHLSEHAGRYLQFSGGEPSANLMKLVHPQIRIELRTAIFRAHQENENVTVHNIPLELDGKTELLNLCVRPVRDSDAGEGFTVVMFEKASGAIPAEAPPASRDDSLTQNLEAELQEIKAQLHTSIEQYETSNEELKASNEELQAMNEELRSASEELETGKEELQSVNEELITVNQELKGNVEELSHANSDLQNLMAATDIGTIFLDRQLSVKRFTPRVLDVFNLIPSDVGRPLSDITRKLKYEELAEDAAKVLRNLGTIEREVQNTAGAWFLARIGPYRTLEDKIDGVVMTFVDITRRKLSEEKLWWQAALVASSHDAIISCSPVWKVVSWNEAAERLFGYKEAEVVGHDIKFLSPPDNEAELNEIRSAIARGEGKTLETVRVKKNGEPVNVSITFSLVRDETGKAIGATELVRDISSRRKAQAALRESDERFRLLMEGAKDYAMFLLEPDNVISYWSAGAQRVFGWSAEEAIGQRGELIFTPEDRAAGRVEKEMTIALQKGSASDSRWHLRKDGSRIWIDGVMRRLDGEGREKVRGFAKIARDATEQRIAEEELKKAHAELEHRVMERTAELVTTNTELHNEMKRRQTLEREILEVTERERSRVGQDLHDGLCQELTATAFLLKSKAKTIARKVPECAKAMQEAAETVNENAGRARDLARGLHPSELGAGGLLVALRELATRTNERTPCRCEFPRSLRISDETIGLNIYRVAQEAVNNALKHARASEIVIGLRKEDHELVLAVTDDGAGIRSPRKKKTMGVHMMKYRADVSGGNLEIESRRGRGTTVTCRVPLES